MQVAHGRRDVAVPQQLLEGEQVDAGFEQMGGETVTQRVNAAVGRQASGIAGGAVDALGGGDADRLIACRVGKQPVGGAVRTPVVTQRCQQLGREQRERSLPPLPWRTLRHMRSGALSMSAI